jgi:hypothetical protein
VISAPFIRRLALLASAAPIFASVALAKDFGPGDLRVCGAERCISIGHRDALRAFSSFYYGDSRVVVVRTPRLGTRAFELRFKDGGVAGIVAGPGLDRTRVYGLNCGRFRRGTWYRLPARAAREVRTVSARLEPLRVTRSVPRSC